MKILVTDGFTLNPGDNSWDEFGKLGDLIVYERSDPNELAVLAKDTEILVVNKTPISNKTLSSLRRLQFIAVSATGFDCVDVKAAGERGIPVSHVPVYGTDSVAQHVFALLLELCNQVGLHNAAVNAGEWAASTDWCFWKKPLIELAGKTLGIFGFGRIGRRVGEIANAFNMKVIAYDPVKAPEPNIDNFCWTDKEELFHVADVVTLHSPLNSDLMEFVNEQMLRSMKTTSFLINVARGKLIDDAALAKALNQKWLAGAAIDVVSLEPISPDNPLLKANNLLITPHIAWATKEARERLMKMTAENIHSFLEGKPKNIVNAKWLDQT